MTADERAQKDLRKGEFPPGTRIGRYRLEAVIGRGGMGTVYRTFDEETRREVATKILLPGMAESLQERFLAECEAEAKIRHSHVMPVYDRGTYDGDRLYFVMELLYEPITLTDVVQTTHKGALGKTWPRLRHWASPARLAADVLVPIAEGVDAANREYGILHRDLKPDNVLIDVRTRRPYLIDFGICHVEGQAVEEQKIVGTPRFLSPEQARASLTSRTDVWGLGALLRYLFTGQPPIRESSPLRRQERAQRIEELLKAEAKARSAGDEARAEELAARRRTLESPQFRALEDMLEDAREGRYPPLPEAMPPAARAICEKAMAKEPSDRYESAAAFAEDVRAWTSGGRVKAQEERDARGAAMAAAGRTFRRTLAPALLTLGGLLFGTALGTALLSGPAETTLERFEVARAEVRRLGEALDDWPTAALEPAEVGIRHGWLESRLAVAEATVASLPDGEEKTEAARLLAASRPRLETSPLALSVEGSPAHAFRAVRLFDGLVREVSVGTNALPPGLYVLGIEGAPWLRVPFELGWNPSRPGTAPTALSLTLPERPPAGSTYVPGEGEAPPFFVGTRPVTYLEYADWIDALDDGARQPRLPAQGFVADPAQLGTWLVSPGFEDRPVTGIRPADAAAYAAWRRDLFGRDERLPTAAEWERAAGLAWRRPRYAALFGSAPGAQEGAPSTSPYGVRDLGGATPEIVVRGDAFVLKGRHGATDAAAVLDEAPAAPDAVLDAGFRLVVPIAR